MGNPTRRLFLISAAAGLARSAAAQSTAVPEAIRKLRPMTDGIQPIRDEERQARIEKARRLMRENRMDAVLMEGGSSASYFTGSRSNEVALMFSRAALGSWSGKVDLASKVLKDQGVSAGRLGVEERVRFELVDRIGKELPALEFVSGDAVTAGCRMIKSPAEIALMQRANDITIAAIKSPPGDLAEGMTQHDLSANIAAAYHALGSTATPWPASANTPPIPHGSIQPQKLREGDMVLIDDGCTVDGYYSDITRTTIFGKPTARQREIWALEHKAQAAAFAAAKVGATCESVDAAARKVITDAGFGPGYKVPGLPHRTGHGIGLDGHEWTNFVRGNKTRSSPACAFPTSR